MSIAFGFCIQFSLSIVSRKFSLKQSQISGLYSFDSIICIHQFSIRQLSNLFIVFYCFAVSESSTLWDKGCASVRRPGNELWVQGFFFLFRSDCDWLIILLISLWLGSRGLISLLVSSGLPCQLAILICIFAL